MLCLTVVMTHALKTLIVDDEALARRGLKLRLAARKDVEVVAEAKNGREALKLIDEHEPDLVFLDIQMPGIDGFEVLRRLTPGNIPIVVFVTAFDEYAIKAFQANALDYLLKPIEDSRLAEALERAGERIGRNEPAPPLDALVASARSESGGLERILVRDGSEVQVIPTDSVDYIEAQQ